MIQESEPLVISVNRACSILGIGRTKINELMADGRLARIKIGRRTLITFDSVKSLITRA